MTTAVSNTTHWLRVNRSRRCPICAHADWCLISANGTAAICPRVPSDKQIGNAGWLHRLDGATNRLVASSAHTLPSAPRLSAEALSQLVGRFQRDLPAQRLDILSRRLGVTEESLRRLGVGWSWNHTAFAFPMSGADGRVRGIRLRTLSGRKFCIPGSTIGLFIPRDLRLANDLLICEGESDTAAMLDLGFSVVGRPGCSHGTALLVELVKRNKPGIVTIMADAGEPGQRGATALASTLAMYALTVEVISPPAGIGDAREWKRRGARRHDILAAIEAVEPVKLRITTTLRGCERRRHRPLATA